jgi:hypothetical protein
MTRVAIRAGKRTEPDLRLAGVAAGRAARWRRMSADEGIADDLLGQKAIKSASKIVRR